MQRHSKEKWQRRGKTGGSQTVMAVGCEKIDSKKSNSQIGALMCEECSDPKDAKGLKAAAFAAAAAASSSALIAAACSAASRLQTMHD